MSDFGGELSIEPIVGVRVFEVDDLGRLRGVSYDDIWTPGENESRCHAEPQRTLDIEERAFATAYSRYETDLYKWNVAQMSTGSSSWRRSRVSCGPKPEAPKREDFMRKIGDPPPHDRANCNCGFWAFYAPSVQYHTENRIFAVVEGYGEVTIGSRGFRAQKARILAVSLPDLIDGGSDYAAYRQSLVRRNYPDVLTFGSLPDMLDAVPTSRQPDGPDAEGFWDQPERARLDSHTYRSVAYQNQLMQSLLTGHGTSLRHLMSGGGVS